MFVYFQIFNNNNNEFIEATLSILNKKSFCLNEIKEKTKKDFTVIISHAHISCVY